MTEVPLDHLINYLNSMLKPDEYSDSGLNGLQVEACPGVSKAAFAVDAGLSIIEKAVSQGANLLIVHHGLFWGDEMPVTGAFGKKISTLIKNSCSLYASHLPLDGNLQVGNAAVLARELKLTDIRPFCEYMGQTVGVRASLSKELHREQFLKTLPKLAGGPQYPSLLFGKQEIKEIGIVTGSGSFAIEICPDEGIDLLISGEPKQEAYHKAKELGVNAVFIGHYVSERYGVLALKEKIEHDFNLETIFIEENTGL